MGLRKSLVSIIICGVLAACSGGDGVSLGKPKGPAKTVDISQLPAMRLATLDVAVPRTLSVSEENSIKPKADIVWRGDPMGDRYEQVHAVMYDGVLKGLAALQGGIPVNVNVDMLRFHALTERTRYSIGGEHEIDFLLSVSNAGTGEILVPPYLVSFDFDAYGGDAALAAERAGITQKVRIIDHVANVIRGEFGFGPVPVAALATEADATDEG